MTIYQYRKTVTAASGATSSGSKLAATLFTTRATFDDKLQANLTPGLFFMPYHEIGAEDSAFHLELDPPTKLGQTTDLKVSAKADQNGAILTCSLRGWMESN
jgi:hypothetical protein